MKRIILSVLFLIPFLTNAQNLIVNWVDAIGGSIGDEFVQSTVVDASGNVYIGGSFEGTVNFNPSGPATNLTSVGGLDAFFGKYTSAGVLIWIKQLGSTGSDEIYAVALDNIATPNVFVAGYFNGTVDFDPSASVANKISVGVNDIFYGKYSGSGTYSWANAHGSTGFDAAVSIKVDPSGNVFVSGFFDLAADFDPSATINTKTSTGDFDVFLGKYSSTGALLWIDTFGSTGQDIGVSIDIDASNVYIAGYYSGTSMDFDPTAGVASVTNLGLTDAFFGKYLQSNGSFVSGATIRSTGDDEATSILVSGSSVYVGGKFSGSASFYSLSGNVNKVSAGGLDIFITKYDFTTSTPTLTWANQMGGLLDDEVNFMASDVSGNVYATGIFQGDADFDPASAVSELFSNGLNDIYVASYSGSGLFRFAESIGGSDYDAGTSIATDASNNVYVAGYFFNTVSFDFFSSAQNKTALGFTDGFVAKYAQSALAAEPTAQPTNLVVVTLNNTDFTYDITAADITGGYLHVYKVGSAPTSLPVDGVGYAAEDVLPDGSIVKYSDAIPAGNFYGSLTAGTSYFIKIYSFNGSGSSTNYLITNPLTATITTTGGTLALEPTNSPTNLAFSNITTTGYSFSFSDAVAGTTAPDGYIGIRRTGAAPTGVPVDGVSYNVGDVLGDGAVRLKGPSGGFSESDGSPSITYFFTIYSYKGTGTSINYKQVSPLTGSVTTLASGGPTVASFNPTSGLVSSSVTITGTGFSTTAANNSVKFNGTTAAITGTPTATSITATVPTGATTGTISVTVAGQTGTSSGTFTVTTATTPTIASFLPISGTVGTSVTLTGANFSTTPGNNIVKFNGTTAVVTASTITSITTSVPTGAATGKITVEVATQTGTSLIDFTVSSSLATEPSAQPTNLVFSNQTSTGFDYIFTVATGAPTGYIILRSTSAAVTGVPVDGTVYASGDALGNAFVRSTTAVGGTLYSASSLTPGTIYHTAIFAFNGSGSSINYRQISPLIGSTTTLSGTDTTEPFVNVNTTPTSVAKGAPVNVTVTFRDVESGISEATISYASLEDANIDYKTNWTTGTMIKGTGEDYTFTIPGTFVKEMGVTYYFYLKNGVGLENYSSDYFTAVKLTGEGQTIPFTGFGTDQTKYRIVSIPVQPTTATADAVFGDDLGAYDKKSWRLFRYQGSTTELNGKSTLVVGNGYWLIASKSVTLDTGPGATTTATVFDPFKLTFSPGWNQIGNPYPYDVKWQEILIWNGSPAGITKLRTYNGNWADGAELEKFSGGFVFNGGSTVTLEIPTIKDPSINGRVNGSPISEVKNPIDGTDWSLNLSLEQGALTNAFGGFGMNSTATDGYDAYDDFNLPRFTDFVEMNHLGKELHHFSYSKDVVPYQENHTWEFSIESNLKESVTMKWDNSFFGENSKQLVLWDVSLQRGFDMRKINHYVFSAVNSGRFKVFYGEENYIKEKTVVEQLVFHDVFPNPASGKVIISFSVPAEEHLTIEVVDLLGRKIATIADGNFKTGYHEVQWNAQDHSGNAVTNGIYITQIKSLRSDQQKRLIINK